MSPIKRRHFLQFTGSTLAAIGLSQLDFRRQAEQYGRALAQDTPRKLALLVGINNYLSPVNALQGCKNDVLLQRELLIHRFGFNQSDIIVLTDAEATRAAILEAFSSHLIAQAKPGDVVVFHYSGHGSLVQDPNPLRTQDCEAANNCGLNGTLVAADPPVKQGEMLILPHIMGRSLFMLRNAVQTENLTLVLDSCYSGAGTRGNVQVRSAESRLSDGSQPPAPANELAYQQEWLGRLNLTPEQFQQRRQANQVNGVAIGSASRNQEALDMPFEGGFHAGAFTYLMTRYLWQLSSSESFDTVRTNLIRSTQAITTAERKPQIPVFETSPNRSDAQKPVYFLPAAAAAADAVVTQVSNDQIEFWLGGVSTQNLASKNTVFQLLDSRGELVLDAQSQPVELQQSSRATPLYGYAQPKPGQAELVQPGMLLREKILGLEANPVLRVGLDSSLGAELAPARTELEQALVSAQGVSRVQPVEQQAKMDYLLGRTTAAYQQELQSRGATELPPLDSVALFNSDRTAVVAGSYGQAGEPVTAAVARLKPKLKLLLASQVLRAITATDSDLRVAGEVFSANTRVPLTGRGAGPAVQVNPTLPRFKAGEEIQIKVENREPESVYLSCLAIDAQGNLIVLYPVDWTAPEESARIDGQKSLTVPQSPTVFKVSGAGLIELLTLVSTKPLSLALKGLSTVARGRGITRGFVATGEDEALAAVGDLLGDLDGMSRGGSTATIVQDSAEPAQRLRDTNTLAAFSTVVEIVE